MTTLKKLICLSLVACSFSFALTGCGNDTNGSTSGNNDNNNAMENAADNVGNAAEDVADGVGNAVDDLVGGNGFDNYDDAHKYFLDTMGSYHSDAQFEVRDEDRNLTDYQEGSKGYRFHLYDTANNKDGALFGEFYVDADTGMIYKADGDNNFTEYRGAGSSINGDSTNGTNTNGATSNTTGGANTNGATSNASSSAGSASGAK